MLCVTHECEQKLPITSVTVDYTRQWFPFYFSIIGGGGEGAGGTEASLNENWGRGVSITPQKIGLAQIFRLVIFSQIVSQWPRLAKYYFLGLFQQLDDGAPLHRFKCPKDYYRVQKYKAWHKIKTELQSRFNQNDDGAPPHRMKCPKDYYRVQNCKAWHKIKTELQSRFNQAKLKPASNLMCHGHDLELI